LKLRLEESLVMSLKEALAGKRFAVTSEIYLPHDKSPENYLDEIYNLRTG